MLLVAAALAAAPAGASAQELDVARLAGRVLDAATRAPLAGVRVRLVRAGHEAYTAGDGSFRLGGFVVLPDTLRLTFVGYRPAQHPVPSLPGAALELLLEPAPVALPDVVSTAARRTQGAEEIVVPVTTVSRDELLASAAPSVDQVLQELPGLQQMSSPPASNGVMIRGIGESRVLVLVDGEPTAGAQLEDRDLSRLSTVGLEQIEVVKGPLSAIYGSQALGGVINLVTRAPDGPLEVEGIARAGSLGRLEGQLSASQGGRVAWRVSGGWRQQDRIAGQVDREGTYQGVADLRGTVRHVTGGGLALRADVSAMRERQRWPLSGDAYGFNDNRGISGWAEGSLERLGGTWRLRAFGQDYTHQYRAANGLEPVEGTGPPTQHEQTWRALLAHSRRIGGAHLLDAGLEASTRRVEAADKLVGGALSDQMLEGYAQDVVALGAVYLNAAVRYTYNSRWGSAIAPSAGVAWEPSSRLRLRTALGRGFRGPSFKELGWTFANVSAGYTIQGNTELEPESSWQLSAGATWAPVPGLAVEGEVYRNAIDNLIDQAVVAGSTPDGLIIFQPRNIEQARTQGAELSVRYESARWAASAGYEYLDARNLVLDIPLNRRAPHTARVRGTHRFSVTGLPRLDLTGRYTAAAPLVGTLPDGTFGVVDEQGALFAVDVSAQARVLRGLELSAGVDNLFDARPAGWQGAVTRVVYVGARVSASP